MHTKTFLDVLQQQHLVVAELDMVRHLYLIGSDMDVLDTVDKVDPTKGTTEFSAERLVT